MDKKNRRRNLYSTLSVNGDLSSLLKGLKVNATVSFDSYETFESTQRNAINTYNYDYTNVNVTDPSNLRIQYTSYSALTNPSANQREYYYHLNFNGGLNYSNKFGKHAVDARAFIRTYQNVVSGKYIVGTYTFMERTSNVCLR